MTKMANRVTNIHVAYEDFPVICRICLIYGNVQPFELNLLEVFKIVINKLECRDEMEDKLPQNICKNCSVQLKDLENFINKCKTNEATLKNIYLERNSKYESSDIDSDTEDKFEIDVEDLKYEEEDGNLESNGNIKPKEELQSDSDYQSKKLLKRAPKKIRNQENPVECKICDKIFYGRSAFANHSRTHKHKRDYKKFLCSICGKNFIKNSHLERHIRTHSGEKPYGCTECGKHFGQSNDLKRHLLTHTRKKVFQCNQCEKAFHQKSCLDNHVLTHTNERNFECSFCDKKFTMKAYLEVHTRTHTGVKPYQCLHCEKQFYQKSGLNNHILTHTGEKPYKCTGCEKTFIQSNHLKEHLRIHSGEKPYLCTYCGKSFAYSSTLKVHLRQHTGETPFVCSYCNKGFHDASNLRRHVHRNHTNLKPPRSKNVSQNILSKY